MIVAWCSRCRKPADLDPDELTDGGQGDPDLLPVLIPPDGWIADPDDDGLVCGDCATTAEITSWMGEVECAERLLDSPW